MTMFANLKSLLKPATTRPARPVRLALTQLEARDVPTIVVPELSSKPDAPYTIYLDFDGMTVDNWGNNEPGSIPAFSIDTDTNNTSPEEFLAMGRAWNYVAEDFAPFNVNVTTVNPRPGHTWRLFLLPRAPRISVET